MKESLKETVFSIAIAVVVGIISTIIFSFLIVLSIGIIIDGINENYQRINRVEKKIEKLEKGIEYIKNQCKQQEELQKSSIKENEIVGDVKSFIRRVNPKVFDKEAKSLAIYFIQASKVQNVPLPVLLAIAWQESHFNQNAVSKAGCVGIMQVNLSVWSSQFYLPKELLYSSEYNILAGAYILRYYYNQTGSWEKAYYRYFGISEFGKKYQRLVAEKVKIVESQI